MTINKTYTDNGITMIPEGLLDTANSPEFETAIDEVLTETKKLILDFSKVEYISSSGLRILLKAQKKITAESGDMTVINVNDSVKEVFELTGFIDILNIQ